MQTYLQSHAFRQQLHEIVRDELVIYFRMDPSFQAMLIGAAEDAGKSAALQVPYDDLILQRLISEIDAFNNEATQLDCENAPLGRKEFTTFLTELVVLLESAITARVLNTKMPVPKGPANDSSQQAHD